MKIGFACGVFDLFHAGHVRMFMECKRNCDYLIVAVNSAEDIDPGINPGKRAPVYSLQERVMIIESCRYVDETITYKSENDLMQILKNRKIDLRFLGDDYRGKPITGADLAIPIHYTDRSHGLSSTAIVNRIKNNKDKW